MPPSSFKFQYSFEDGRTADAVLFFPQGLVAIDSKFPLESFENYILSSEEKEKLPVYRMDKNCQFLIIHHSLKLALQPGENSSTLLWSSSLKLFLHKVQEWVCPSHNLL